MPDLLEPMPPLIVRHERSLQQQLLDAIADGKMDAATIHHTLDVIERVQALAALSAFNKALTGAQGDLQPIVADSNNPQTKSKYASTKAIVEVVTPIASKWGLTVNFDTADAPLPDHVRVIGHLRHVDGHREDYHVDLPADGKGAKGGDVMTRTHATGSALTYGQRYLLKLIFNLAIDGDDDGNKASVSSTPAKDPDGYRAWFDALAIVADNGTAELEDAWVKSKGPFKTHLMNHDRAAWDGLKAKASKVKVKK